MAGAPQLQLLFLAIAILASVAAAGFLGAWLALRRGAAWWGAAGQIVGLAASWYCVSMTLTLFNRLMLGFTAFNFPITMSLSHMAIKGVLGVALAMEAHKRAVLQQGAPGAPALPGGWLARQRAVAHSLVRSQRLTRRVFSRILVPLGTTTALDVWLSAVSLQTLEISVYTTAKSCALIFTLGFSLAARLQQPTWGVVGTVLMIGAGVILCSVKPAGVDAVGLVCVLIAAACGAARWVFTEQ
jgi:solute carrier family 35 protein C2